VRILKMTLEKGGDDPEKKDQLQNGGAPERR
jgi:hypothetical protein